MVSDWVKGRYKPKEDKYLFTLADKLGLEIFDVLEKTRPDPDLHYIQAHWVNIPPKERKAIREIIAKYETKKDKKESP